VRVDSKFDSSDLETMCVWHTGRDLRMTPQTTDLRLALDGQATISIVSTDGVSFFGATGPWDGNSSVVGLFSVEMFKSLNTDDPLAYLCSTSVLSLVVQSSHELHYHTTTTLKFSECLHHL
jgi:hypothetical protein